MSQVWQQLESENLWGYLKRLRFVRQAIADSFIDRQASSLRVLDVGCGNGSQLSMSLIKDGFELTGVDTDQASIEHARRLAVTNSNARFLCCNVEELGNSEIFDVVILSEVLEHVDDPSSLLQAGLRRLRDEGVIIVTVPNGYGEFEIDWWLFRHLRLQRVVDALAGESTGVVGSTDNQDAGHVQFFTRSRLKDLFDKCGLSIFREGASSLVSGPILGHLLGGFESFIEWNARMSDKLPPVFSSGWFFALRLRKN
jgi:SAM-dependent methyltransferase